jgi:beta-lactamase superfamily II metal-dependent hydrolase
MNIKLLKANRGDSIHLTYYDSKGKLKNILIDGGTSQTYTFKDAKKKLTDGDLKKTIEAIKPGKIDLVILTHIDDDHIHGFLKWFAADNDAYKSIGEIWFNSGRIIKSFLNDATSEITNLEFRPKTAETSILQGVNFEKYISEKGIWNEAIIKAGDIINVDNLKFQILSPNDKKLSAILAKWNEKSPFSLDTTTSTNAYKKTIKKLIETDVFDEDSDASNGSSIAFILTKDNLNYLFLGDAHPSLLISELKKTFNKEERLKAEYIKLSHHGAKKNNPIELFELIETNKYLVSTNGAKHGHPDKVTIARIISVNPKAEFYFNYPILIDKIISDQDRIDYPEVRYLNAEQL